MITLHENDNTYKIILRGSFSHIKSEKKLREAVERTIVDFENRKLEAWRLYGKALRNMTVREFITEMAMADWVKRIE